MLFVGTTITSSVMLAEQIYDEQGEEDDNEQ